MLMKLMGTGSLSVSVMAWWKAATVAFVLLAACSAPRATENPDVLCEEFRTLLNQPARLSAFAIAGVTSDDDMERLADVDFDSDGVADQVVRFCPNSASIIPADPCTLDAKSSSTGETYALEEQRLYVIKFKSSFYVVAGSLTEEGGPMTTNIFSLTGTGMRRICSYQCDPRSECKHVTG